MTFAIVNEPQKASIAVAIIFLMLPTIAVVLRIMARRVQRVSFTPSDYCIFAALVCNWGICTCAIINVVHGGVGTHQKDVSLSEIQKFLSSLFAIELLWAAAEGLVKTSMCLLYIQIFQLRWFRISAYITIGICNAFAIMVILSTTFICLPVELNFNPTIEGTCGNRNALWLTIGVLNIATDLLVVFLPLPTVWNLQVPKNKKIALIFVFSLGLFVCIVSCIRLQYLLAVDFAGDMTYTVVNAVIWSLLEPTLGVTVGCLPAMVPLFRKWFPSGMTSNRSGLSHKMHLGSSDVPSRKGFRRHSGVDVEASDVPLAMHSASAVAKPGHHHSNSGFDKSRYDDRSSSSDRSETGPQNGISVVKEWAVWEN